MSASKKKKAERTVGARPKSSGRPSETRANSGHAEPGRKDTRISAKRTGPSVQPSLVPSGEAGVAGAVKAVAAKNATQELVQSPRLSDHRGAVTVALSAAGRGNPPALPVPIATFTV